MAKKPVIVKKETAKPTANTNQCQYCTGKQIC